jgi:hypothetical protein
MHKLLMTGALLISASLIPATLPAQTQSDDKPATTSSAANPSVTKVTGCLQAGKKAGTFKLIGDDGTTYMLRSKSTDLSAHVGHTVTVSGRVMTGEKKAGAANGSAAPSNSSNPSDATAADQNASGDTSNPPAGAMHSHLMVHSLAMVSESCKTAQ